MDHPPLHLHHHKIGEKNGKQKNQTRVFLCFFFQVFGIEKLEKKIPRLKKLVELITRKKKKSKIFPIFFYK
jgi:hypothetical protein